MGFIAGLSGGLGASGQTSSNLMHTMLDIQMKNADRLSKMYQSLADDTSVEAPIRNEALRRLGTLGTYNPFDSKSKKAFKDASDTSSMWELATSHHLNNFQEQNKKHANVIGLEAPMTPLGGTSTPPSSAAPPVAPSSPGVSATANPFQSHVLEASGGEPVGGSGLSQPLPAPPLAQASSEISSPPVPQPAISAPPGTGRVTPEELLTQLGVAPQERFIDGRENLAFAGWNTLKNGLTKSQAEMEMQLELQRRQLSNLEANGGSLSGAPVGSPLDSELRKAMLVSHVLKEAMPSVQQATINGKAAAFFRGRYYDQVTGEALHGDVNRGQPHVIFADPQDGGGPRFISVAPGDISIGGNTTNPPKLTKPAVTRSNTRSTIKDPFGGGSTAVSSSTTSYGGSPPSGASSGTATASTPSHGIPDELSSDPRFKQAIKDLTSRKASLKSYPVTLHPALIAGMPEGVRPAETPGELGNLIQADKSISLIQRRISEVRSLGAVLNDSSNRLAIRALLTPHEGMVLSTGQDLVRGAVSDKVLDYVTKLRQLREDILSLRKFLGNQPLRSDKQMAIMLAQVPDASISSQSDLNRVLDSYQSTPTAAQQTQGGGVPASPGNFTSPGVAAPTLSPKAQELLKEIKSQARP